MAGGLYWADGYWHVNYWHANYWLATPNDTGSYWHANYFHANYWHANYWALVTPPEGIQITGTPGRTLTKYDPTIFTFSDVYPPTKTLDVAAQAPSLPKIMTAGASMTLTAPKHTAGAGGYVAGDIDLQVYCDSAFTFTDGIPATCPTLDVAAAVPIGVIGDNAQQIMVQSAPSLTLGPDSHIVRNNKYIFPETKTLTLTGPKHLAGRAETLYPAAKSLTLSGKQADITAEAADPGLVNLRYAVELTLTPKNHSVYGLYTVPVPDSTFQVDNIENASATTSVPSNVNVDARTGFRVIRGGLTKDAYGVWTRPDSADEKHPQELARSVAEEAKGADNPEGEDVFVNELYPQGVTADDL